LTRPAADDADSPHVQLFSLVRYSGGGQRSTHYLGSALSGRGHDVTVVFTKTPWDLVHPPASLPYRLRWAALPDYKSHIGAPLRCSPRGPWPA